MKSLPLAPLALVVLAACAPAQPPAAPPPPAAAGICNDAPAQFGVGQAYGEALAEQLRRRSGARLLRVVPPGMVITQEYNSERLTVETDAGNRVVRVRCG